MLQVDNEDMLVTATGNNQFTVTRGIDGTTAAAHAIGAQVLVLVDPASIAQLALVGAGDAANTTNLAADNWTTALSQALTASATATTVTITFTNGPVPAAGTYLIQVDSEEMLVTALGDNQFTVTRGANNTTVAAHAAGAAVSVLVNTASPSVLTPVAYASDFTVTDQAVNNGTATYTYDLHVAWGNAETNAYLQPSMTLLQPVGNGTLAGTIAVASQLMATDMENTGTPQTLVQGVLATASPIPYRRCCPWATPSTWPTIRTPSASTTSRPTPWAIRWWRWTPRGTSWWPGTAAGRRKASSTTSWSGSSTAPAPRPPPPRCRSTPRTPTTTTCPCWAWVAAGNS